MYNKYFGFVESPFSVTPDPRFFYATPIYQEAFAALSYGIEAKKGFIVITGEAGTGKTTLLRKLMRSLEATIHSVFVFNTDLSFAALLRVILRDLGLPKQKADKVTMTEQLNAYLIEQAQRSHIVALLIDEAQKLSDETLEGLRLLSNLETDKGKLIQIVLMGQPELEGKLDQANLRQLKQRVAIQCRLAPLKGEEVNRYIHYRVQAAGYEGEDLFDPVAVEQIAFYSRGIPRVINIICDNTLLIAYAGSKKQVAGEVVQEVVRDLRLTDQPRAKTAPPVRELEITNEREEVFQAAEEKVVDKLWQAVSKELEMRMPRRPNRPYKESLAGMGLGMLLALVVFGSAGAALYRLMGTSGENTQLAKQNEQAPKSEARDDAARPEPPAPQDSPQSTEQGNPGTLSPPEPPKADETQAAAPTAGSSAPTSTGTTSTLPETEKSSGSQASGATAQSPAPADSGKSSTLAEKEKASESQASEATAQSSAPTNTTKSRDEIKKASKSRPGTEAANNLTADRKRVELQIYKAIHNRAISGVEVAFVNGRAYLDGRVDSENQRLAADRAARSVPEVKQVRNRITINTPPTAEQERQRIQLEVYKAINTRAITGVDVSVVNGIAYLDGRVDTESQRLAAERSARAVPDVRHVRNRIVVSSPFASGGASGGKDGGSLQ
jgi:general secretion pathway protein A